MTEAVSNLVLNDDISYSYNIVYSVIILLMTTFPLKTVKIKEKQALKSWVTADLAMQIRARHKLYKKNLKCHIAKSNYT